MMVEAILDAAARILEREGAEAFTTNRIAEVAGVSVGTYYQYFPNKTAVLAALAERHAREMQGIFEGAQATTRGQPLEATLRAMISAAVTIHLARPALQRELDRLYRDGDGLEDGKLREQEGRARTIRLLEAHRDELLIDDIPMAVTMLRSGVKAILRQVLSLPVAVTPERLTEELMALCLRYLTGRYP